jgi:alkanesulfonate monooxygenase SsuD/methylene tetrahydromethanopterin reductase-like flavin-dependent oxidoreductase (luciferase family)
MGQATMDGFWGEMDRLGKDRNPYRAGFAQTVAVAESRQQAIDLYSGAAEYFFGRCLHIDPRFALPPGYTTEATMRMGMQSQVGRAAAAAVQRPQSMEELVEAGYIVIGSPDEVAEQLSELAHTLNVGHLMLLLQFGNMDKALTQYNTRLYAERVLPKVRGIFSEWEDRWWPKPMPTEARAEPSAFSPRIAAE